MPLIKGQGRLSKFRHGLGGIDQVSVIAFLATEMLPPQLKAEIARELPSAVAETAWVHFFSRVALFVDDGARDLRVVLQERRLKLSDPTDAQTSSITVTFAWT
jgi:hypothetical protein